MNKIDVLNRCTIDGYVVKLPNIVLDRPLYNEIAKDLKMIGGKWVGRKTQGFVFNDDPTELLESLKGEGGKELKKKHQFFGTPSELADRLVELAQLKSTDKILEPSAGQGAIVEAIQRVNPDASITCVENMKLNSIVLARKKITHFFQDFLTSKCSNPFDKVIANPPFSNNQDIDHIYKMIEVCKPGGIVVSIASNHWRESKYKKETEFRNHLNSKGAVIEEIPEGAFKESGTMVAACIVIIYV